MGGCVPLTYIVLHSRHRVAIIPYCVINLEASELRLMVFRTEIQCTHLHMYVFLAYEFLGYSFNIVSEKLCMCVHRNRPCLSVCED